MTKKIYHGWFSKKASEHCGYFIYKDREGKTVVVTEVTENMNPSSLWDDLIYVGVVDRFVQSFQKDQYRFIKE